MTKPFLGAVIFDMDGVITNTMPSHCRAWSQVFREEGLRVPRFEIYKREGQKGIESVREIFNQYGRSFTIKYGQEILRRKEALFKKKAKVNFIPGSRGLISLLQKRNLPMAIVTGTARHEIEKILPKKIFNSFKVIVSGSDVSNGKPHPEPYLKAIKMLGMAKNDAVVIENAPFGIRSAKAAGLTCMAIATSLPQSYLSEADYIFHGFRDLSAYITQHYGL